MQIVIYESSSFGGCFEYSQQIAEAYRLQPNVASVTLILPHTHTSTDSNVQGILCADVTQQTSILGRKLHFLWRNVSNPFRLFRFLISTPASWVLLNDFEQLTAVLWVPFYKVFLRKHRFAVLLHDPDRDQYPPAKWFSAVSMRMLMWAMNIGFYHEVLPPKWYYQGRATNYVALPHGIYPEAVSDALFTKRIQHFANGRHLFLIPGNVRAEKNTAMILSALQSVPNACVLIVGKAASGTVDTPELEQLMRLPALKGRCMWENRYVTAPEMAAAMQQANTVMLYYSASFRSQSAILNSVAPYRKQILVSDTQSALSHIVIKFDLSKLVPPDNPDALTLAMKQCTQNCADNTAHWNAYLEYASWRNNAQIALAAMNRKVAI